MFNYHLGCLQSFFTLIRSEPLEDSRVETVKWWNLDNMIPPLWETRIFGGFYSGSRWLTTYSTEAQDQHDKAIMLIAIDLILKLDMRFLEKREVLEKLKKEQVLEIYERLKKEVLESNKQRAIINEDTNEIFLSIAEAAEYYNVDWKAVKTSLDLGYLEMDNKLKYFDQITEEGEYKKEAQILGLKNFKKVPEDKPSLEEKKPIRKLKWRC